MPAAEQNWKDFIAGLPHATPAGADIVPLIQGGNSRYCLVSELARGAGLLYTYSDDTTGFDPGGGHFRLDNADWSLAAALYISATDGDTNDLGDYLDTWDDSTNTVRGYLFIRQDASPAVFVIYAVTDSVLDNTTWREVALTYVAGDGSGFTDGDAVKMLFIPVGDKGDFVAGEAGEDGADVRCQNFRLTTESGVSVSTSDRSAQGTIYLTPHEGGQISLYDGAAWVLYTSAEVSLALSSLTSGKNYDVFAYYTGSAVALELSAAWTNDTTQADALTLQDGIKVKSGAPTRRRVGTIRTTGTSTTEDSATKRFVWNENNRVVRPMKVLESTDTWNYTTDTIRQTNAASGNKVEYVTGDASALVQAWALSLAYLASSSTRAAKTGVGIDSTTAFSGDTRQGGYVASSAGSYVSMTGSYRGWPGLGYHYLAWLEKGPDGTAIWVGDNGGDGLQTGLLATIEG